MPKMIELSRKLKEFIKLIPLDLIYELWDISQEHDYASIREEREWNREDEFWQRISYAHRENNNPKIDIFKLRKELIDASQK